jgi:ABC-2 type transport system ATP-binding protein
MLQLSKVSKAFRDFHAVKDLSLTVNPGEFLAFLGPNGAGKTTTIKMITGLLSPTSGTISIGGIDISSDPVRAKALFGYIPDQPYMYERLTGKEFLQFSGGLYGLGDKQLRMKISEATELLQLGDWLSRRTEEYSQGMKQRIVIASALLHDPKLLVVDEPMVGLDAQSAQIVKRVFVEKARGGTAILMSTHSLPVAEEICHSVAILKNGELIYRDTLAALHTYRQHDTPDLESFFIQLLK